MSTLDRKWTRQYIIDSVATTLIQLWNHNVKFKTFSQRLAPMLCQFCEERQMWTIHGLMVAFT